MIAKTLEQLGFTSEEIKIYLKLLDSGSGTAGELSGKFAIAKATLYGALQRLCDKGIVTRSLKKGVRTFHAVPPENISLLFKKKISELKSSLNDFENLLPGIISKNSGAQKPRIQFFEGKEGVQNILNDMLLYRNIPTFSYWPIADMVNILGAEFFHYHNKERIRNKLYTKALWPEGKIIDIKTNPSLGAGKEFYREIRITPNSANFTMGYWIYADKVALITSSRESFGMLIESTEFRDMLLSQWNVIWDLSKPLVINPQHVKKFIDELRKEEII